VTQFVRRLQRAQGETHATWWQRLWHRTEGCPGENSG
jgi:hypothetical protein